MLVLLHHMPVFTPCRVVKDLQALCSVNNCVRQLHECPGHPGSSRETQHLNFHHPPEFRAMPSLTHCLQEVSGSLIIPGGYSGDQDEQTCKLLLILDIQF